MPNEMYASDGAVVIVPDENSPTDQPEGGDADARDISLKLREVKRITYPAKSLTSILAGRLCATPVRLDDGTLSRDKEPQQVER